MTAEELAKARRDTNARVYGMDFDHPEVIAHWARMEQQATALCEVTRERDGLRARVVELEALLNRATALMTAERWRPCG